MQLLGGGATSGAVFFSIGRFSEALTEYENDENHTPSTCTSEAEEGSTDAASLRGGKPSISAICNPKAVYAACNRAAAKVELEMYRSCLHDCDEAIRMEPLCLRAHLLKGQAFQRLGKPAQARQAFEAGVIAGKGGGDVLIFVQLTDALKQQPVPAAAAAAAVDPEVATGRGPASIANASSGSCPAGDTTSRAMTPTVQTELASCPETDERSRPQQLLGADSSSCEVVPEEPAPCADSVSVITSQGSDGNSVVSAGALIAEVSTATQDASGEGREASEEEREGGSTEGVEMVVGGGGEEEGEGAMAAATTTVAAAAAKKKKKKKKKKRSKAGKTTWAGEEDEHGHCLTLSANADGGGVVVDGLSAVLAASNISHALLEAARAQLCHSVGNPDIDNLIALGYLQVNTGNYRKAVELFRGLLSIRPGLVGAHLGLGSALALLGGMEVAVASFSSAIEASPLEPDCWKRRGQTRAAMGHVVGALSDLDRAVELSEGGDPDVLHQRGMVYHKLRYFTRAALDFGEVVKSSVDAKTDWNMIGLCRAQLGEPVDAERAYRRALSIDASFKEAWANLGSLLRDWGKGKEALIAFDNAIVLDSAYVHAHHLRGECKHGMGDHRGAQADFLRGQFYDSQDERCRYMAALCMHARGQLDEAVRAYDALLSLKPGHQAWYARECCVYLWANFRRPWRDFSPDAELDPEFKEGWCKRHDPMTLKRYKRHLKPTGRGARVSLAEARAPAANSSQGKGEGGGGDATAASSACFMRPAVADSVLRAASPVGPGIQLRCPGFLSNARQHRMFGLASLEVAQLARSHWDSVKVGGGGAMVRETGSSAWRPPQGGGEAPEGRLGMRPIGYRDVFDVAVRWRQLSEPNDPVWWIDRLTPEAFREGFGLQTPMVNGQLKVIRYHPYCQMALNLMKKLMCEQSALDDEKKAAISHPDAGLEELYKAVGHDHWVVTPCERSSLGLGSSERPMEGTRLTIVASTPEGFEFTIRTPGTPGRWLQYDEELCAVWEKLTAAVRANANNPDGPDEGKREGKGDDVVCDLILEVFYYWVNFGPLSRGSAACGYTVLYGLMAAAGWRLTEPLPENVQMDWEAILRPTPEAFMATARPWLRRSRRREDMLEGVPAVANAFPTALEATKALNGP